ncbi:MAG: hypothetical protein IJN89_07605, partial [Anaerotignum sp.]|nr:hypothetical protein [Anaerotignum sp.]
MIAMSTAAGEALLPFFIKRIEENEKSFVGSECSVDAALFGWFPVSVSDEKQWTGYFCWIWWRNDRTGL